MEDFSEKWNEGLYYSISLRINGGKTNHPIR